MGAAERAKILRELQSYGTKRSRALGLGQDDVHDVVRQSLNRSRTRRGPSAKARALVDQVLNKR